MYLRSLKNTGSTLLQLATVLHHAQPPPPPPMSPTSEAATTSTPSTPLPPPPPPLSTWDSWEDDCEMAVAVATKGKDLVEIVKELDECFLQAADSGGKLSSLLEVPVMCGFSGQGASGKLHVYGKNLSPLFSLTSKLNVFVKLSCDDDGRTSVTGRRDRSHRSTVERLYSWEKKLYQEVKNVESLKIEHAKRAEQLRRMKFKKADYLKIEKSTNDLEKLESKLRDSSQAIESTSNEIVKLREEELYPQLVDLVNGLMGMWRNLYESHQVQMHIVQQLKFLHVIPSTDPTWETQRQAVLQLESEVQQWFISFCNLVQSQRDYVQSLTGWLRLSLFQSKKTLLSQTKQDSIIYTLCEEWQRVVDNAPDKEVSKGIKALLAAVQAVIVLHDEEHKQKERVELSFKELEKKTFELQALERKLGLFSGSSSEKDPVGDKRANVEMLRIKTAEERGKYEKLVGVTRTMTLNNLQIGLPTVFQAVTDFANVWAHGFESVYNRSKRPEEAHDL